MMNINRVPSDDVTKDFFVFQHFEYHISVEHDEKPPQPKFGEIGLYGAEIWLHEYLISPTEVSVNWPGSYQL